MLLQIQRTQPKLRILVYKIVFFRLKSKAPTHQEPPGFFEVMPQGEVSELEKSREVTLIFTLKNIVSMTQKVYWF